MLTGDFTGRVTEYFDALEATFTPGDAGQMRARVRIIKAGESKNRRNYRLSALKEAHEKGVFDGTRMFVDHSDKPPLKRSLREMVAAIESTELEGDTLYGNAVFFDKEFYEFAQRAKEYMGDSIDAQVRGYRYNQGGVVKEDIQGFHKVRSVDFVVFPAAGGGIDKFVTEGVEDVEWTEVTLDLLRQNAPQLIEQIKSEVKKEAEGEGDKNDKNDKDEKNGQTVTADSIKQIVNEAVREAVAEIQQTQTKRDQIRQQVTEMVSKSGLPSKTQHRLISSLAEMAEFAEKSVTEAIDSAKEELKEAGLGPRITGNGTSGPKDADGPKVITAREGVEEFFMGPKKTEKKDKDAAGSGAQA